MQHRVDRVRKGFPDFNRADTLRVSPEGLTVSSMDLSRVFVLRLPSNERRDSLIARLQRLPHVIYAEPNSMGRARLDPNDQHFSLQWGLKNTGQAGGTAGADIKATQAWDIFTGSSSVIVGIVDGGRVQQNHPEFAGRVSGNLNTSISNHATHVAGIAAAKGNNSSGVAGVDWNAQINTQTIGDIPQQAAAVRAAVDAGTYWPNVPVDSAGIWIMNADGSQRRQVIRFSGRMPDWSPIEDKLVFIGVPAQAAPYNEVGTIDLKDSLVVRLTVNSFDDGDPSWSSDGSKIAWGSYAGANPSSGIWIMNANGTNQRQLTRWGGYPSWSPDGRQIVYYQANEDGRTGSLWIMNADGSNQRQLTKP